MGKTGKSRRNKGDSLFSYFQPARKGEVRVLIKGPFCGLTKEDVAQATSIPGEDLEFMQERTEAVITFESEELADETYIDLQGARIRAEPLGCMFTGDKNRFACNAIKNVVPREFNLRALLVDDIPGGATEDDVRAAFPRATKIEMRIRNCCAIVHFDSEKDAETAFTKSENLKIKGRHVTVLYSECTAKQYTLASAFTVERKLRK